MRLSSIAPLWSAGGTTLLSRNVVIPTSSSSSSFISTNNYHNSYYPQSLQRLLHPLSLSQQQQQRRRRQQQIKTSYQYYSPMSTRLFGTKLPLSPSSSYTPGEVTIVNNLSDSDDDDDKTKATNFPLSESYLRNVVTLICKAINFPTYDITLMLCTTAIMQDINNETRGINTPTDVLSFPMHESPHPGVLEDVEVDVPELYTLGEIVICWDYIVDKKKQYKKLDPKEWEEERGSYRMMMDAEGPEGCVVPLLIHGVLHLVGYDHEYEEDWEVMVEKEEEVWRTIKDEI